MVCCTALGRRVYDWAASRSDLRFAPVSYTHDVRVLAQIDRFVAINSVLAVDLSGQANAEMLHGRQVSGTGGSWISCAAPGSRAAAARSWRCPRPPAAHRASCRAWTRKTT